jgi:hypothetical protein
LLLLEYNKQRVRVSRWGKRVKHCFLKQTHCWKILDGGCILEFKAGSIGYLVEKVFGGYSLIFKERYLIWDCKEGWKEKLF